MSLSPESEAILAPLRAKVKEQVRIFYFVTFLAFLLNTWNAEALTFASTVIHGRHEKSPSDKSPSDKSPSDKSPSDKSPYIRPILTKPSLTTLSRAMF